MVPRTFVLAMDVAVGLVGLGLSVLWSKATGRDTDRDTVIFLAKMWAGISIFGMIMAFTL